MIIILNLLMISFSCAHAQNTLLERTQVPESSFFSFKMPGLPSSWLSSMPGYMSVLKGTVSDWYERFSQATAQIKIADHKELIVGACAAGVVSYLAYCAVGHYKHFYWQHEYNKLVQECEEQQKSIDSLRERIKDTYYQIRDLININPRLVDRNIWFFQHDESFRRRDTFTMDDFMSAVAPSGASTDDDRPTYAAIRECMTYDERAQAKQLVREFRKLSGEFLESESTLTNKYYSPLRACEAKLGIKEDQNPVIKRGLQYKKALNEEKRALEDELKNNDLECEEIITLNKRLRDVDEEMRHL